MARIFTLARALLIALACVALAQAKLQMRFDVYYNICPTQEDDAVCPPAHINSLGLCMCDHDLIQLNSLSNHYIAVPAYNDRHQEIVAAGNEVAFYVNRVNDGHDQGKSGVDFANKMYQDACTMFHNCSNVAQFWILNEISHKSFDPSNNAEYKNYLIDVVRTLAGLGIKPILASPYWRPKGNVAFWRSIAKYGYIGVENYVGGQMAKSNGFSVSYLKKMYQASADAFKAMKIPKSKLLLCEGFGQSKPPAFFGRSGISSPQWNNLIKLRAQVIHSIRFGGFIAYGWWGNQMNVHSSERDQYYTTYNSVAHLLP